MAVEFIGVSDQIKDEPFDNQKAELIGVSFVIKDSPSGAGASFSGLSNTIKNLLISTVTVQDFISNLLTFQISSAILTDIYSINNFPLTFNVDSLTANEIDFGLVGVNVGDLILNFTIDYEVIAGRPIQETIQLTAN